jgi:predicted Rossmann fold flavoprotein
VAGDVVIVGAGAAGLATAIFLRRANPSRSVILLDSAKKPGAKILISGGSRCNVTNVSVTERDFWGGRSTIVRRILRAFPIDETIVFFREIGVPLHEEADGKLFPDSNRSRDVLDALVGETSRVGATLSPNHRVVDVVADRGGFAVATTSGGLRAEAVVLATGGKSLPKTGSDGGGLEIAHRLGHTIVPTTPALAPLRLTDDDAMHRELTGVAQDVELGVWIDGAIAIRLAGAMLWTHFGVSGPVALNASRHWMRAAIEGRAVAVTASFCAGRSFGDVDEEWTRLAIDHPRLTVQSALARTIPAAVASALLNALSMNPTTPLAHFTRDDRRRLVRALVAWPLPVAGTRGYNFAEATAGGVELTEIDPSTMESRLRRGLHLVGEMLDVDGRIGGFNFQWAWCTGRVAGEALASGAART